MKFLFSQVNLQVIKWDWCYNFKWFQWQPACEYIDIPQYSYKKNQGNKPGNEGNFSKFTDRFCYMCFFNNGDKK